MTKIAFWDFQYFSLLQLLLTTQEHDTGLFMMCSNFFAVEYTTQQSFPVVNIDMSYLTFDDLEPEEKAPIWKKIEDAFFIAGFSFPEHLSLDELDSRFSLKTYQVRLIVFFFLYDRYSKFQDYFFRLEENKQLYFLEMYTKLPRNVLIEEMRLNGYLLETGILCKDCEPNLEINRYNVAISISQYISYYLDDTEYKPLVSFFLEKFEHADLALSSFNLPEETKLSAKAALTKKGQGIILFYGEPGTGKTELSKTIALDAGLKPCFLKNDQNGNRSVSKLFTALILINPETEVLIVDEAEAFLSTENNEKRADAGTLKSVVNQFLDDCQKKVIFIVNKENEISPSTLRRMQVVVGFKPFTCLQRQKIWKTMNNNNPIFSAEEQSHLSLEYQANPSRIRQVYDICENLVQKEIPKKIVLATAQDMLARSGELLHSIPFKQQKKQEKIDPNLLNLDVPTSVFMDQLNQWHSHFLETGEGINILFYGVPGTGKTAFAKYLVDTLSIPVVLKRASDLFGSYVGMTERNIREAFEEAKDCALIIDEADSFLSERENATRSWERTQVNEFLTCMENFNGLFIATTNFNSILDSASLRRFQYKIEFLPPTADQILKTAHYFFPELEWKNTISRELSNLDLITPGDFKTVSRRLKYAQPVTVEKVLAELKKEVGFKQKSCIGFN